MIRIHVAALPLVLVLGFWWIAAASAQTVWSGPSLTFTKPAFADDTLPANQDHLTGSVALTRGSSGGLYNVLQETYFSFASSPADTEWATSLYNPTETISAANWPALAFTYFADAYGGGGMLSTNITQLNAVVHLISEDIYLDLAFTSWGEKPASGAGFSYLRSTDVVPEPTTITLTAAGIAVLAACARRRRVGGRRRHH